MDRKFSQRFSPARIAAAAVVSLILCAVLGLAGCNQTHPDEKDAVNNALTANGLGVVTVSQDRDKGVMTLSGDVETQGKKDQAAQVAKQAAPDYTISNQVGVRPIGMESQAKAVDSDLDSGIEDNCKAMLKAHKNLDKQSVSCSAKNGTLTLSGSVKTPAQKAEAGKLAKQIPNVKETVNEIEVKSSGE
ncbi:MAG TPA: BON domain-containing protein [Terriglobales bacterium]|nr:BON domain-containing protein [Terriglobales bacterium]